MTIRLAIVRQRYNAFGGAERFVATALEALAGDELDLSLTLLTRRWTENPQGHRTIECNPPYLGRLTRDFTFARCVRKVMVREKFDLVQSHERIAGCDIFRAGDGVHAAWLEHRNRQLGWRGQLASSLSPWHRYTLAAERRMFADPGLRAVICISELVRNDIQRFYGVSPEKLHVIYNGIDLDRYHPGLSELHRESIREQYGIPAEAPLFLYVGSGFERKGVSFLLQALAISRVKDSHLFVVGSDKSLSAYRQQAVVLGVADRVYFTGGLQDVRPFYGAADAFVLPTLYEPLSNAVLEALACGLPCAVSHQCGAAELIRPGVSGYVCDAFAVEELAANLDALAAARESLAMRQAARQAVAELGVACMSRRLLELYRSLL